MPLTIIALLCMSVRVCVRLYVCVCVSVCLFFVSISLCVRAMLYVVDICMYVFLSRQEYDIGCMVVCSFVMRSAFVCTCV